MHVVSVLRFSFSLFFIIAFAADEVKEKRRKRKKERKEIRKKTKERKRKKTKERRKKRKKIRRKKVLLMNSPAIRIKRPLVRTLD